MNWFEENNISYLGSIPSPSFQFENVSQMNGYKGTYFDRTFAQISMLFSNLGGEEGYVLLLEKKDKV